MTLSESIVDAQSQLVLSECLFFVLLSLVPKAQFVGEILPKFW